MEFAMMPLLGNSSFGNVEYRKICLTMLVAKSIKSTPSSHSTMLPKKIKYICQSILYGLKCKIQDVHLVAILDIRLHSKSTGHLP
jgi:hypothetical protein